MDTMPIKVVILNVMPEAMMLMYLGLILIGIKPDKKRVFVAGIIQGIACFYIRKHFSFGPHVILQYMSLILVTWIIVKTPVVVAAIANGIALIMAILLESMMTIVITSTTGITMAEVMSRSFLRMMINGPYLLVLVFIIYVTARHGFTLENEIKFLSKLNGKTKP